jgi:hypothetical protein
MPGFFVYLKLLAAAVVIFGAIPGTTLEEVVVELGIGGEIDHFTGCELAGGFEHDRFAMVIGCFIVTGEPGAVDVFAALGSVRGGYFIFREDGAEWAFGDTGTAIDTGVGVNIEHGESVGGITGDDTFDRANFDASAVTYTQAGNNMSHFCNSPFRGYWSAN